MGSRGFIVKGHSVVNSFKKEEGVNLQDVVDLRGISKIDRAQLLIKGGVFSKSSLVKLGGLNNSSFYLTDTFEDKEDVADISDISFPDLNGEQKQHSSQMLFELLNRREIKKLVIYGTGLDSFKSLLEGVDYKEAKGLKFDEFYEFLFVNNGRVVVILDSDKLLDNSNFFKILNYPLHNCKVDPGERADSLKTEFIFTGSILFVSKLQKFPTNYNIVSFKLDKEIKRLYNPQVVTYVGGGMLEKYSIKQLDLLYSFLIRGSEGNYLIDMIEREVFKKIKYSNNGRN